jgi:hypothetical protein
MLAEHSIESLNCYGIAFAQDGRTVIPSTRGPTFNVLGSTTGQLTLWSVPDGNKIATHPADDGCFVH